MEFALAIAVIVCIILGWMLLSKNKTIKAQQSQTETLKIENARLNEKIVNAEQFNRALREEAKNQFKAVASDIFSAHSEKLKASNNAQMSEILNPLKEEIKDFKKKVDDTFLNSSKERSVLGEQMRQLMDLNKTIGKEARELTEALSGNTKIQGDWGELILQTILDKSGLVEGENYFVQLTKNEDGEQIKNERNERLRPDVVVSLPDKKSIVIDSKVSLTAYLNYVNADNEADRTKYGKAHVLSVRSHLKELDSKNYQDYVGIDKDGRIDYVLMFIPNEHAYMAAMSLDPNLWMEAYEKRVVIISPAHVISTLRLIAQLWTRDKQTKNALLIAEEGGKLYDKFVGFIDDMQSIGDSLNKASEAHQNALNKLKDGRGNIMTKVQKLQELGAKASKSLPKNLISD